MGRKNPKPKVGVGIDVGSHALRFLRITTTSDPDCVQVLNHQAIEYPKPLYAKDAAPDVLLDMAIEELITMMGSDQFDFLKGRAPIVLTIPLTATVERQITMPPVDASKVADIIQFEARQTIPFSMEDVNWDWQRTGGTHQSQFLIDGECVLQSAKKDYVDRRLAPWRNAGVPITAVQTDSMALQNVLAWKCRKDELRGDQFLCIVDMGGESTNMLFADVFRVWSRSIPLGGRHFTNELCKEFKLTFAKGEHLKCNASSANDPQALFAAIRPVYQDLKTELDRTINFFRSENKHAMVTTMFLVGGGFLLPGIGRDLEAHYAPEVTVFVSPSYYGAVTAKHADVDWRRFGPAYGAALQALGVSRFKTSLGGVRRKGSNKSVIELLLSPFAALKRYMPRIRVEFPNR